MSYSLSRRLVLTLESRSGLHVRVCANGLRSVSLAFWCGLKESAKRGFFVVVSHALQLAGLFCLLLSLLLFPGVFVALGLFGYLLRFVSGVDFHCGLFHLVAGLFKRNFNLHGLHTFPREGRSKCADKNPYCNFENCFHIFGPVVF